MHIAHDYVNPTVRISGTKEGINIENQTNDLNYAIYDLTGQMVFSGIINSEENICVPMPAGVYIVKTENGCAKVIVK